MKGSMAAQGKAFRHRAWGNLEKAIQSSNLISLLAKLKYFCHLVMLHEALLYCDNTNPGENDLG